MAWKSVDLPTLARPTWVRMSTGDSQRSRGDGLVLTMPLFRLLPGRPRGIFFSSTAFLGGILFRDFA